MKILSPKFFIFSSLLFLLTGINYDSESVDANTAPPYSEVFPVLDNVVSMGRLSNLVYKFRYDRNFTCADFASSSGNITKDITCEWYIHEYSLGTQVLLVSNKEEKYIAVIFAGTDDIRTSLEDTNILTTEFGNNSTVSLTSNNDQRYKRARIHSGFNDAVFTHGIWDQVYAKVQNLLRQHPSYSLWTTGHSLGAANAILAATAFALLDNNRTVLSVNFGCPQIGNHYWRDFFNSTSPLTNNLSIWRVVLAWDLVPRLPYFFYHVGHTIQIDGKTNDVKAYYEHYGEDQRGYAGVPTDWYSKSYTWLPYALHYHHMYKYLEYMERIEPKLWVQNFFVTHSNLHDDIYDNNFPDDLLMPEDTTKMVEEYGEEFRPENIVG